MATCVCSTEVPDGVEFCPNCRRRIMVPSDPRLIRGWLFVLEGDDAGTDHRIYGDRATVGRDPEGNIVFTDGTVSTRHCELVRDADGWKVTDLGSANGSAVDGQPVTTAPIRDGSVLTLGNTVAVVKLIFD